MPKLSKKSPSKKRPGASKVTPAAKSEINGGGPALDLPQVWLPVDLSTIQNDVGGNLEIVPGSALPPALRTKGVTSIREDASAAATFGDSDAAVMADEMLTEEERVAQFWAIEESAEPRGWLDDEELDYARRHMPQPSHLVPSSPPPSHPPPPPPSHPPPLSSLPPPSAHAAGDDHEENTQQRQQLQRDDSRGMFSYTHSQVYSVKCVGELHSVSTDWLSSEDAVDLVKVVETAQCQGRIPRTAFGDCSRIMMLSKYGIKIVDMKKQRVFSRHALHNIVSVVHYADSSGLPMLAVRVTKGHHHNKFDLFLYQCDSESQANEVCAMLREAFDSVLTKLRWEEGMGAIGLH